MDKITISIPTLDSLPAAADAVAAALHASGDTIVAFDGEMGAGKTTFIRALVERLGADPEDANSPSFSIVNEYETPAGRIYHFDLYRLDSPEEALEIGIDDYFDSGNLCLLEWPGRIGSLLPADAARVEITVHDDQPGRPRTLTFTPSSCLPL